MYGRLPLPLFGCWGCSVSVAFVASAGRKGDRRPHFKGGPVMRYEQHQLGVRKVLWGGWGEG